MPHLKSLIQHPGLILLTCMLTIDNALAVLPTPVPPSTGAPNGNWLDLMKGYVKDAGLVIGLLIAVVVFLWMSWILIAKFNEARRGQADWGEVGVVAVVGVGVMIFISYILTEASNVI
ncbi:MAG TPA: TIGR03745 family integrating conjugative element membrane protein [Crenotrichaceae bacterium]|nr:TIGR03745 family integrating conjugative element membrane protein [Crenotrichaceae bacterium]